MLERKRFLPEDEARYQFAQDILCNENNSDPLALIVARCSIYWLQVKTGEKLFLEVAKEMGQYLDFQEKEHPDIYHKFIEEHDRSGLSLAIKLREEILGTGNLRKYQEKSRS